MKAIILAAGVGSRISKHIDASHKCLLPIKVSQEREVPLLLYTIETLKKYNINDISLVTGYRHRDINQVMSAYDIDIHYNPFYELVNSIGSLWFCNKKLEENESVLILNADTFIEESLLEQVIEDSNKKTQQSSPLLLIDSSKKDCADVKVRYEGNILKEYGKQLEASMAESLDLVVIPQSYTNKFRMQLETMLENKQFDTWWESALVDYKDSTPVEVLDVTGNFWGEIDFLEDYQRIVDFCNKKYQ